MYLISVNFSTFPLHILYRYHDFMGRFMLESFTRGFNGRILFFVVRWFRRIKRGCAVTPIDLLWLCLLYGIIFRKNTQRPAQSNYQARIFSQSNTAVTLVLIRLLNAGAESPSSVRHGFRQSLLQLFPASMAFFAQRLI